MQMDQDLCIRQYAFALVGDMQKHLGRFFDNETQMAIIELCLANMVYSEQSLDPMKSHLTVCNNSCWCIGLMCVY